MTITPFYLSWCHTPAVLSMRILLQIRASLGNLVWMQYCHLFFSLVSDRRLCAVNNFVKEEHFKLKLLHDCVFNTLQIYYIAIRSSASNSSVTCYPPMLLCPSASSQIRHVGAAPNRAGIRADTQECGRHGRTARGMQVGQREDGLSAAICRRLRGLSGWRRGNAIALVSQGLTSVLAALFNIYVCSVGFNNAVLCCTAALAISTSISILVASVTSLSIVCHFPTLLVRVNLVQPALQ